MTTTFNSNAGSGSLDSRSHSQAVFQTLSRKMYPRNIEEVFTWARELWFHHGIYAQAISKAVRYFMTEIEIEGDGISYESKQKYKDMLEKNFDILTDLATIGDDYIAFGNSFTSVHMPFIRNLRCPECGSSAPLKYMLGKHAEWKDYSFVGVCPKDDCRSKVKYDIVDTKRPQETLVPKITRWPPQYIQISCHPTTGRKEYFIDLSQYTSLCEGVKNGTPMFLEETPLELIRAIQENKIFKFNEGELYHMANNTVAFADADLRGWGLPKFMSEFETIILIAMLDKFNEAIIADYLVPFRVISPPSTGGPKTQFAGDAMLGVGTDTFLAQSKSLIDRHRKNPTDWNFFPFPVQYQVLGGEANSLAPVELMEHAETRLLHSMGIPQEIYAGSVNNSAGPIIGFKMFERTWQHFTKELNNWLTWFVQKVGELYNWESVTASLVPVSLHEDPEIRATKLELAAARIISQTTALRSLGLDRTYEQQRLREEEDEDNKVLLERQLKDQESGANMQAMQTMSPGEQVLQAEQEAMAQQDPNAVQQAPGQMGGGIGAGMQGGVGMGMAGGPSIGGGTLDDLLYQAEDKANQLLYADPYTRRSQLLALKKENEALHAQVKASLQTKEQQAAQYGLNMVRSGQLPME